MKALSQPHTHCQCVADIPIPFCSKLVSSLGKLKRRLQQKYELALPGRSHLIRAAVDEAEALAWQTPFPHLFLPDLAEARLAEIVAAREPAFVEVA